MIPTDRYNQIIDVLPILCVDVVISNRDGEYLLIKRDNEPRKGEWWVIGGRLLKGETLEQAVIRKVREETALTVDAVQPIGYYEAVSQENPFGLASPLHAVSVVFSTVVDNHQQIRLDDQSSDWKFSKELPSEVKVELVRDDQPKIITYRIK